MSEQFVNAVMNEKNIDARKQLEKILQAKCEKRIKDILEN